MFNRLQQQMDDSKKQDQVSLFDITDLPDPMRKVMLTMLRHSSDPMTKDEIKEGLREQPDPGELSRTLDALVKNGWLTRLGEGEVISYRLKLGRKRGSKMDFGLWSSIEDKTT
jgi:hypothetical protein